MKTIIETDRLLIRELVESDVDAMFELHSDPEVHRFLGNNTVADHAGMMEIIRSIRQQYIDFGVGRWVMIDKQNQEFIGWTGLQFVTRKTNNHKNYHDLGYRLLKRFWGQGYATESAIASLDYAFNELNLTEVYAMADSRNIVSHKILKKIGLKFIETFDYEGVVHHWLKIKKSEYTQ